MSAELLSKQIIGKQEGQYIDKNYPITVEEGVESLRFDLHVEKSVWATCMVYDPKGNLRGQLLLPGDSRSIVIHVNQQSSSPYTVSGEIMDGRWHINVSCMSREVIQDGNEWGRLKVDANVSPPDSFVPDAWSWIDEEETSFTLNTYASEEVYEENKRWYKGDFHTHTTFTDGEMTREENIAMARQQELDFFVATDHNIVPTSWHEKSNMLVIPGTEVTSSLGHFNIINPNISPFEKNSIADMYEEDGTNKIIAQEYGNALVSINHPFLKGCPWVYDDTVLKNIDTLEIINDPTYPDNKPAIEKALIAWNILLNDGHRITGIGGSDSHLRPDDAYEGSNEPSLIGDPGTFVYSEQLSADSLINNVRKGHVTVSRGGFIHFTDGHSLPGETSSMTTGKIMTEVETSDDVYIEWIVDGLVKERSNAKQDSYAFNFSEKEYHWIRVDVRNPDGTLYGFSNPIYFGYKEPEIRTWQEVLKKMNED